ncbi:hypothetical protein HL658_09625 [Azospirillum sp. RWY-5-1]|uniref:Uncharacterized protein n=1 Tax=Azospirillum oleiclasticum TaxID=2735135 RepID=A0ABX2TBA4_9PROT|nr:hypothetical protein [Azospirillum oleiclasticum]NYZ12810.1 hypothetical protein [Azospirillum oleiclasticum]NYZ19970.1 hypothetical protein [Azospirillum oleiclasticum]
MKSYSLILNFPHAAVDAINRAGQKVVLVKSVTGGGGRTAWVTFAPFQQNVVIWSGQYGIYASTSQIETGAMITQCSIVDPAQTGVEYPFQHNTFQSAAVPDTWTVSPTQYATGNENGGALTFGLRQAASVNGTRVITGPVNAVSVLPGQHAIFQPHERICVFVESNVDNGAVVSTVSSNSTTIDLTTTTSQTATYNAATGTFVVG